MSNRLADVFKVAPKAEKTPLDLLEEEIEELSLQHSAVYERFTRTKNPAEQKVLKELESKIKVLELRRSNIY
jgi:hypothetical protein